MTQQMRILMEPDPVIFNRGWCRWANMYWVNRVRANRRFAEFKLMVHEESNSVRVELTDIDGYKQREWVPVSAIHPAQAKNGESDASI